MAHAQGSYIYNVFGDDESARQPSRGRDLVSRRGGYSVNGRENFFLATALPLVRLSRLAERARNTACRLLAPVAVCMYALNSSLANGVYYHVVVVDKFPTSQARLQILGRYNIEINILRFCRLWLTLTHVLVTSTLAYD